MTEYIRDYNITFFFFHGLEILVSYGWDSGGTKGYWGLHGHYF